MEDRLSSAADLPYFEGDFWPNVLEESIKELDQEEEEKRKQAEAAEAAAAAANAVSCKNECSYLHAIIILSRPIYLLFLVSYLFRYSRYLKMRKLQTVRRRVRRRRRNPTSLKRIKGKIARNRILLRPAMIFPQKSLPPWKSTKKYFSLLGCTALKVQPVWQ